MHDLVPLILIGLFIEALFAPIATIVEAWRRKG
jgi:hypothetical protein